MVAYAVMREEAEEAFSLVLDHPLFAGHQTGHIDAHGALQGDTEIGGPAAVCEEVGRGNEHFGRNTAPVEAGPAGGFLFDQGDIGAKLCGADRRHVTAGTSAHDADAFGHHSSPSRAIQCGFQPGQRYPIAHQDLP